LGVGANSVGITAHLVGEVLCNLKDLRGTPTEIILVQNYVAGGHDPILPSTRRAPAGGMDLGGKELPPP